MKGLGVRQRRMLTDMLIFGDGKWPDGWKFRNDHGEIMTSLWFRGTRPSPVGTRPSHTTAGSLPLSCAGIGR